MSSPHRTLVALLALAAPAVVVSACGGDDEPDAGPASCNEVAADHEVTIAAIDLAWEPTCLRGPADERFTIVVDNRDDGVNHNLHLTDAPDDPATELESGPVLQELEVTLPAGEYEFVCDIHPNMVGTLEVAAATGG